MDNAIEVKYDGLKNITYECLKRGVIYADIGSEQSDMIVDIIPARHYEGKTPDGEAKLGFIISVKCSKGYPELREKIVFDFDGERLELEVCPEHKSHSIYKAFDEECTYSLEEIIGINGYVINKVPFYYKMLIDLQPKDIKRIAEAKDVCVYFDSNDEYNINGGNIALRNGQGCCQIEGIQGVMKRAYHYFVDATCYTEYCSSFIATIQGEQQKVKEKQQIIHQQKVQAEQEKKAAEELYLKSRKKYRNIMIIAVIIFVFCLIIGDSGFIDVLSLLDVGLFLYGMVKLITLNAAHNGGNVGGGYDVDDFES